MESVWSRGKLLGSIGVCVVMTVPISNGTLSKPWIL